uniref:Uncharacterized protein n=1 Tax=Rhizophora mucronata TaxID=61149 RepID=A0A2P2IXV2_RHIMU
MARKNSFSRYQLKCVIKA